MAFEKTPNKTSNVPNSKVKSPVGNFENIIWDKQQMKEEVMSYEVGTLINWSDLARRYNIKNTSGETARNGGQITQEWLKSVGVDIGQFKRKSDSDLPLARRKKLKGAGGEISLTAPSTNENLKCNLKEKIASGEYTMGELIVPKKVFCHVQ
jgi:hypothetical protein